MSRSVVCATFAAILLTGLMPPARAQSTPQTIEQSVAHVIVEALAPATYGDWAYRWDAVSIRVSKHMRWHLPAPDTRDRPAGADVRRTGWVEAAGAQFGVSAYGNDEAVTSLSFDLGLRIGHESPADKLLEALRAEGVTMTLVRETGEVSDIIGPSTTYRLAHPKLDGAELIRGTGCTSPNSAAAQRCWTTYELLLGR